MNKREGCDMKGVGLICVLLSCSCCSLDSEQVHPYVSDELLDINVQDESGLGAGKDVQFAEKETFNIQKKREEVIAFVGEIEQLFKKKPLNEVLDMVNHTRNFKHGELYPFVYSVPDCICLAHGEDKNMVWKDMSKVKDSFGDVFVQSMVTKAREGGGWHTYQWRDASKVSYVKLIEKDGQQLMIGSGFYPHSKEDLVISLVKGAVSFFNDKIAHGIRPIEVWSQFNYQVGDFIIGDLYIFALNKDVVMLANGDRPGDAGQSYYDVKDDKGVYYQRIMVNAMKDAPLGEGRWFEYTGFHAPKRAYMERVVDDKGGSYFIASGYNPTADREAAVELVKKGYQFMKAHGRSSIVEAVNDQTKREFRYGPLNLFIYDFTGTPIAYGSNIALVGKNLIDLKDETGRYVVREIIEKARDEGAGWLDFRWRHSFFSMYVEAIDLGSEKFIIGTGVYPITKESTMMLMVKSAKGYLKSHPEEDAFKAFVDQKSNFVRGDLSIFVYDMDGVCYADGDRYHKIWKNCSNEKDDDGKLYVKAMLMSAKMGPSKILYKENGARKLAYIESVQKGDKMRIIGSSFWP